MSQPHRAQTRVVLAELGSLSVEFTRLAQITREPRYYDAIARITQEFEAWQNNTKLPGLWPKEVDASGCKKPDMTLHASLDHSLLNGPGNEITRVRGVTSSDNNAVTTKPSSPTNSQIVDGASRGKGSDSKEAVTDTLDANSLVKSEGVVKRQLSDETVKTTTPSATSVFQDMPDCEAQGLASPPGSSYEDFTLGGQADSTYEYLPKQYMLLGGLEDVYRSMYERAVETTKKYLLFRPMLPDNRNVLLSGVVRTTGNLGNPEEVIRKPEGTHLTCFVGGMFAIGAKIFDLEGDLDIAWKLTDGCVWAYEATTTGIMPEHYLAAPCRRSLDCPWNETKYHELLDPYRAEREQQKTEQEQRLQAQQHAADYRAAQVTQQIEVDEAVGTAQADIPKVGEVESIATAHADIPKSQGTKKVAVATTQADIPTESEKPNSKAGSIVKRQLGDTEIELPLKNESDMSETPIENTSKSKESDGKEIIEIEELAKESANIEPIASQTVSNIDETGPPEFVYTPPPILTHEEFVKARIKDERLPPGMTKITGPKYILRSVALPPGLFLHTVC